MLVETEDQVGFVDELDRNEEISTLSILRSHCCDVFAWVLYFFEVRD